MQKMVSVEAVVRALRKEAKEIRKCAMFAEGVSRERMFACANTMSGNAPNIVRSVAARKARKPRRKK